MKCSNCSAELKPIVAVDIDGTLGDYHGHFVDFSEGYMGYKPYMFPESELPYIHYDAHLGKFSEWWAEAFGSSTEVYRQAKLAYRQGGMKRTMPIFTGAQALCWAIRDAGAELWVTTTRPYLSLDNIVPDTVEWLRRWDIEYDGMLFDDDKYTILGHRVDPRRVVAVFDDIQELVEAAEVQFPGRAWLVKGKWNNGTWFKAMCDLDAAADLATNAIHTWRSEHERD